MPQHVRLRPTAALWRIALTLALLALLLGAQARLTNDLFPFGVLDQFAKGTDPDGEVVNTCLQGVLPGDERREIPFGSRSVGVSRAEVENTLPAIEADPELLAPLAAAYDRRHPRQEPLEGLVLCQRITDLSGGAATGETTFVELVRWEAP